MTRRIPNSSIGLRPPEGTACAKTTGMTASIGNRRGGSRRRSRW